uniref:Uncharacterized protein n=1 Tax=Rhizophora mucronata TaxID=61149 RepID=A0A2P2QTD9_RHIMU
MGQSPQGLEALSGFWCWICTISSLLVKFLKT